MKLPVYQMANLSADQLPQLNNILSRIIHAVNSVEFGSPVAAENVWCAFTVVEACCADECASATHTLRRRPIGTIAVWQDAAAGLYKPTDAASADTTTQVFYIFDTDVPSAVLLLI